MGSNRASEVLFAGKKLNASEALKANLVSEVVPFEDLIPKVNIVLSYEYS